MALPRLVPALLAVFLVSGCGASPAPTSSSSVDPSPTKTATSPSGEGTTTITLPPSATPTKAPTTPPPAPSPTAAPPPAKDTPPRGARDLAGSSLPQFVNAAMDTTCLFDDFEGVSVRCDVLEPRWHTTKPGGCQDAYGDAITLGAVAKLICHGDTIFSPDVELTLKPGQSAKFKGLWCSVLAAGVSCSNPDGHGMTVSKSAFSIR